MSLLLREAIGGTIRRARTQRSRTLRDVSREARVSLGYLSEIERGRKEPSSELLAAICAALALPLPDLLDDVADALRPAGGRRLGSLAPAGVDPALRTAVEEAFEPVLESDAGSEAETPADVTDAVEGAGDTAEDVSGQACAPDDRGGAGGSDAPAAADVAVRLVPLVTVVPAPVMVRSAA